MEIRNFAYKYAVMVYDDIKEQWEIKGMTFIAIKLTVTVDK